MQKILKAISVLTVTLAAGIALANAISGPRAPQADRSLATDGSFRDGLYVGRLTAQQGRPNQPPVGRWSTKHGRDSFLFGYLQAYQAASVNGGLTNVRR